MNISHFRLSNLDITTSHWGRPGTNSAAAPAPGTVKWVWILIPVDVLAWLVHQTFQVPEMEESSPI